MLHTPIVTSGPGSVELPRSVSPIVKANDLLFVHFERPDLERAEQYLRDFGLIVVSKAENEMFLRGTGSRPYVYQVTRGPRARFIGLGLSVPSADDLQRLSKTFSRPIERAAGPGGGSVVRLIDPEGVEVDVLHGVAPSEPLPTRARDPAQRSEPDRAGE